MRTDRELLELAAKAVGLVTYGDYDDNMWAHPADQHPDTACRWNPLTDDGDALRLAVKLGIQVTPPSDQYPYAFAMEPTMQRAATCEDNVADPYAATRRVIVRAAAEISVRAHPDNKDGGANA